MRQAATIHSLLARTERAILSPATALIWALAIALALSLEFLVQPFIWRNWSLGEIGSAWIGIAMGNAVIAACITLAALAESRIRLRPGAPRALLMGASLAGGATLGEVLRRVMFGDNFPGTALLAGAAIRWTVVAGGVSAIYWLWRRDHRTAATAERAEAVLVERKRLASLAELNVLQRQIEPHFLFNTLANVRGLYRRDPERGEALVSHLARYMRARRAGQFSDRSTLGEELAMVRAYLGVCEARMGPRLSVSIDVDARLHNHPAPPLAIATLVENAIIHGLEPRPRGGHIAVSAVERAGVLHIAVEDDGVGFTAVSGAGIGLANTRARLRALFGERGRLTLASRPAGGVIASLDLPVEPRP